MDALLLARLQFALTVGFHFIFPPITIGLAWLLVIVEFKAWRTGDHQWQRMGRFFAKLLAITFAVGVATGIVMEFQFGTNWASYSKFVGDIFGAPLAAEGIFAFFLESSFLGLYLFGRGRVSPGVHWFAIFMVALGATISAFWIIVANSWQQTPAGYVINHATGRAELTSFVDAVFNPSTLLRFFHTMIAALIAGAFFMAGISAYLVLKQRQVDVAGRALRLAVVFGFVVSLMAVWPTGHHHARQVASTQPEKFAALEGIYNKADRHPLVFFAFPLVDPPELLAEMGIPGMLGWLTYGDTNAKLTALDEFPPDQVPKGAELWISFVSFHTMVMLGMIFIGVTGLGVLLFWRKRALDTGNRWSKLWLRLTVLALPLPVAACEFGWTAAEVGRQPWIVYKELRTAGAASVSVGTSELLFSIIMFGIIYLLLGAVWIYLLYKKVHHGPDPVPGQAAEVA